MRSTCMKRLRAERQAKIDLQKKIQAAVVTDKGWEAHSARASRAGRHAVVPEPAALRPGEGDAEVKQPILIIQGDLDSRCRRITPISSPSWRARARRRRRSKSCTSRTSITCLSPATTGEVAEYAIAAGQDHHAGCRQGDRRLAEAVGRATEEQHRLNSDADESRRSERNAGRARRASRSFPPRSPAS